MMPDCVCMSNFDVGGGFGLNRVDRFVIELIVIRVFKIQCYCIFFYGFSLAFHSSVYVHLCHQLLSFNLN